MTAVRNDLNWRFIQGGSHDSGQKWWDAVKAQILYEIKNQFWLVIDFEA